MLKSIAERKKICIFVMSIRRNNKKIEIMFKVRNTINEKVKLFETMELVNDHIKSADFIVDAVQYVIFDNSATENSYVCESGRNTGCAVDAWIFETKEEAQSVIDSTGDWAKWATVESL